MSDIKKDFKKDVQDIKRSNISLPGRFGFAFSNNYHTFIVQKAERLASALYVITGFARHDEPVRLKLRTCALDLVTYSCDSNRFAGAGADQFATRCAEIATILETAVKAGLVSPMNADLICDEYASLARFVKHNRANICHLGSIGTDGSVGGLSLKSPLENDRFILAGTNGIYKRHNGIPKKRQSDRRLSLLAIFKTKDKISIKDAVSSVIGCSEKTIQRELLSLVREGILLKEGERRWTTYRKAT